MKSIIGAAFFALAVAGTPATAAPLANTRVFAQAGAGQTQLVDWDDWHNRWRSHHRWGSHGEWGGGWDLVCCHFGLNGRSNTCRVGCPVLARRARQEAQ